MKRKTFSLACWLLFHLLLLLGNAVTSNANTTATTLGQTTSPRETNATAITSSGNIMTTSLGPTTLSRGTNTTAITSSGNITTTSLGPTTPSRGTNATAITSSGNITTTSLGPTTPSRGTNTTAITSSVTSTSTAPPRKEENLSGQLRPWEVVLVTLASVAMAVILVTGFLFHFRNSPGLRNLFDVDLLPTAWPSPYGTRATATDFRGDPSSVVMELTGRREQL